MNTLTGNDQKVEKKTTSQMIDQAENDPQSIDNAVFDPRKQEVVFTLNDDQNTKVAVHYASEEAQLEFQNILQDNNITRDSKGTGSSLWWSLLTAILPFVILIAFWIFLMNQVQGGGSKVMSFGKSRAKRMTPDAPKIGFKDRSEERRV